MGSVFVLLEQDATFHQGIGAAIIPVFPVVSVIPAFWSFQFSGRPVIPVVPAFRSFRVILI
jgi:hypothetical protein